MSRKQRLFAQLDRLESEFKKGLVKALRECASGSDESLFLSQEMRPEHWPPNYTSPITDELLSQGDEILALRSKLALSTDCLASRFREACRVNTDLEDHHRLGARRLAQQMLAEIENAE